MFLLLKYENTKWQIVTDVEQEIPKGKEMIDLLYGVMHQVYHDPELFAVRMSFEEVPMLLADMSPPSSDRCPFSH